MGNTGRLLDPRRTPVRVVGLRPETGSARIEITGFEDAGAVWEVEFERIDRYQFAKGEARAAAADVAAYEAAIERLDRPLRIECASEARRETTRRVAELIPIAARHVAGDVSLPDPATRAGCPRIAGMLDAFLEEVGVSDLEEAFARRFVSNPHSGELVKGHRIVIAELGLATYDDRAVRDPTLFEGRWSRKLRAEHVVARLAFVRALFAHLGLEHVGLYRGLSTETPLEPATPRTFVSATFDRTVAESHFDAGTDRATRLLLYQPVPVERIFMTYHETSAMNRQFKEAEAVLLHDPDARVF